MCDVSDLFSCASEKAVSVSSTPPGVHLPSVSFVTAKPWASTPPPAFYSSEGDRMVSLVPPSLTESLLMDFEEHKAKLKLDESSVSVCFCSYSL